MFSGIVEEIGRVREIGTHSLTVEVHAILDDVRVSDSICVSGVCLTVIRVNADSFTADVMPETLRRTKLGSLVPGKRVNLERALTPSTRMGGHFVLGHVDGVGRIVSVVPEESATLMTIQALPDVMRYVAMKGSVTIDGVSLTVAMLTEDSFTVSLVSYTYGQTTLGEANPGDAVNLEVDVLARYVERLQQSKEGGLTWELLQENGFM
ncbi:MAG: riboflavin synthase [Dehalococcoidia bacterium]|nr:riboflavin synthase [Dehalococcoidia bacterium]